MSKGQAVNATDQDTRRREMLAQQNKLQQEYERQRLLRIRKQSKER
jgi:hypothetical protein